MREKGQQNRFAPHPHGRLTQTRNNLTMPRMDTIKRSSCYNWMGHRPNFINVVIDVHKFAAVNVESSTYSLPVYFNFKTKKHLKVAQKLQINHQTQYHKAIQPILAPRQNKFRSFY